MNEKDIENIFEKYMHKKGAIADNFISITANNYGEFVNALLTKHELLLAELKAKVYAYEKIISNSNFKTLVEETKDSDD